MEVNPGDKFLKVGTKGNVHPANVLTVARLVDKPGLPLHAELEGKSLSIGCSLISVSALMDTRLFRRVLDPKESRIPGFLKSGPS